MIDRTALLDALKPVLLHLEKDLRARSDAEPSIKAKLTAQYEAARASRRTAEAYSVWRDELVTQIAVAWVLGTVFIRFLEDNELLDHPWISGPGDRRTAAEHEREEYFRTNKLHSDRDYLEHGFRTAAGLPGMSDLFDPKHNPLWQFGPTGDAVTKLFRFWQERNPDTGVLNHDFTDPAWDTRFLGDLYQDLSKAARKRYALLQTPLFIEEFILDRTLDPAIQSFGLKGIRMIDPTCGSGHFVLGGFDRILKLWQQAEPATPIRELAQRALDSVFGVDLNPFAVAIARFRLLIAALKAVGINRLKAAPNFRLNLAVGDSLLHGRRFGAFELQGATQRTFDTDDAVFRDELKHHYDVEDTATLRRILGQQYHAVVGNPPYIAVKDSALKAAYKNRYPSCAGKWVLAVPFLERFFDLGIAGEGTSRQPAGFVGQITSNSFMKGEFGKKLVENFLPKWELTHVLDTSHVFIRDYGTPTVILFGRNQPPINLTLRAAFGTKGEEVAPEDPATAAVWRALVQQIDHPGTQSEWMSVIDAPREKFHQHPWSIGGGGAAELKEALDEVVSRVLEELVEANRGKPVIGFSCVLGEDEPYLRPSGHWSLSRIPLQFRRHFVDGEDIRDWAIETRCETIFPYNPSIELVANDSILHALWPDRTILGSRTEFSGKTYLDAGRSYFEFHQIPVDRNKRTLLIAFGDVVTHNSFVLSEGLKLFNRHAPIIQLKSIEKEAHARVLGLLNSSTACFYLKQVCQDRGGGGIGGGLATEQWEHFYSFNGTKLAGFPVPDRQPSQLSAALIKTSTDLQGSSPSAMLAKLIGPTRNMLRNQLASAKSQATGLLRQLIGYQEELDWQIYESFKLVEAEDRVSQPDGTVQIPPNGIELGQRAFEIVLARRIAAGEVQTTWFERHGSTPITEVPSHWPAPYRELVDRRIQRIADDSNVRLIEQPEYKRRWNTEPWDEQLETALEKWLLDRIECAIGLDLRAPEGSEAAQAYQPKIELLSTQEITDLVLQPDFRETAEIYRGRADFDPLKLVAELIQSAAVPFLPGQRYKETGLRKRAVWEDTWDKQRTQDTIDEEVGLNAPNLTDDQRKRLEAEAKKLKAERLGEIPVPPRYAKPDFRSDVCWSLRGKLDVPKERFISYPGCSRDGDPCLTVAWAGLDHLQQAKALAAHYGNLQATGAGQPKLLLVLAGLNELLPWLKQWHNQLDPEFGLKMGDYYEEYVREEAKRFGKSLTDLKQLAMTTI
jgi:hypothetical protein